VFLQGASAGGVADPAGASAYLEDDMRRTGQTTEQLKSISKGSVYIVHTPALISYVRNILAQERGEDFAASIKVRSVSNVHQVTTLYGLNVPIEVDHAFWQLARPIVAIRLHQLLARYRAKA
jgi:hypothetical protein